MKICHFSFEICFWNQFLTSESGQTENTQIRITHNHLVAAFYQSFPQDGKRVSSGKANEIKVKFFFLLLFLIILIVLQACIVLSYRCLQNSCKTFCIKNKVCCLVITAFNLNNKTLMSIVRKYFQVFFFQFSITLL